MNETQPSGAYVSAPSVPPSGSIRASGRVVPTFTGFGCQLLDGPHAGSVWTLEGCWELGRALTVDYYPEDQFATPVAEGADA